MKAVFQRELHALMHSVWGWLVLCIVPAVFAVMTSLHLLSGSAADYIRTIVDSTLAFSLILPIYAAMGFSADRRSGADKLLHSLPLSPVGLVLGRYAAWCVPFLGGTLISCLYPVALGFFAHIAPLQTVGGMLIYALCGMMIIALALCLSRISEKAFVNVLAALALVAVSYFCNDIVSGLIASGISVWTSMICIALLALFFGWKATRNPIGALVIAIAAEAAALLFMGGDASASSAFWNELCGMLNMQARFVSLYIGVLDLGDLVFLPLATAFLLAMSAQGWRMEAFEKRRGAR